MMLAKFEPFDFIKHGRTYDANPLSMTTADIADAIQSINDQIDWLFEREYTSLPITKCRARLAALRAELIRRTA